MNLTHQKLYLLGILLSFSLVLIFLIVISKERYNVAKNYRHIYNYRTTGVVSAYAKRGGIIEYVANFKDTNLYSFEVRNKTALGKVYLVGDTVPVRYNTLNPELAIIELESQRSGPYEQTQTLINIVWVALITSGGLLFLAQFYPIIYEYLASFVVYKKDNFL